MISISNRHYLKQEVCIMYNCTHKNGDYYINIKPINTEDKTHVSISGFNYVIDIALFSQLLDDFDKLYDQRFNKHLKNQLYIRTILDIEIDEQMIEMI